MNKIEKWNPILKGALVAGMLILAIFVFVGLTKILPRVIDSIGGAFSNISTSIFPPKESITISLSSNSVKSGEILDVSFVHKNKVTAGVYEFKFDCSNKDLSMILIDGPDQINLPCTATSTLNSNPFKIIPQLRDENSFIDTNIYVTFYDIETGSREAMGKVLLTIQNGNLNNTSNQENTSTTTDNTKISKDANLVTKQVTTPIVKKQTTNQYANNSYVVGKPDLRITAKDTGTIVNNIFVPKTVFGINEISAVRFDITNSGNTPTGAWQFTAVLPTYPSQVFPSGIQPSLKPGETIEYTLSMRNLAVTGNNIVTVIVDPNQSVSEVSEINNTIVMTLVNSGTSYSTGLLLPPTYNNYYNSSNSDLMLKVISRGYIDRNNGRYYVANSVSENDRVAIRIEIENIGDGETGPFIFTADLSGNSNGLYTSPVQNTFYPKEKRQYTIDFDPDASDIGKNTIKIRLDTNNTVNETNENNNVLNEDITVY